MYGYGFLSRGALPIGVGLCMAVRPDLGQVFSHLGGDSRPRDGRVIGVNRAIWRDVFLAETLVSFMMSVFSEHKAYNVLFLWRD